MKLILLTCLTCCCILCYGQSIAVDAKAKKITEFSFRQMTGGVIVVKAKFNNLPDNFNFILDTGSGAISLDSSTAAYYKIPHSPSGRKVSGIAGVREVDYAPNNSLTFPGLKVDSLDFFINDYQILSGVYGIKIDGIIGYSFLKRYIVKVNFDSTKIQIFTPGKIKYPKRGTLLHPAFTALPIQSLTIKDNTTVSSNFYIDTGAGLSLLISSQFNKDSSFISKKRKQVTIQIQGLGGKKELSLTTIKSMKLGPYKFKKVPTTVLNDEFNALSYPHIIGLIGNDILRRFNLIINYPNKDFHLLPNSHFKDEFDYSYTGLSLYYEEGLIVIDDVIKDSPAFKGGLKEGDIIKAVNNNFVNDISTYNNLMNEPGRKITIIVIRDNELKTFNFKVGKIY